ncbi:hypothetical protein [Mycobacterium sp.]|uniref:hypothetical protein n=1 Tax=Mycobacterium sp. TaxID=1785 RepID=UPI003C70CBB2
MKCNQIGRSELVTFPNTAQPEARVWLMPKFEITWQQCGITYVDADDKDAAIKKFKAATDHPESAGQTYRENVSWQSIDEGEDWRKPPK